MHYATLVTILAFLSGHRVLALQETIATLSYSNEYSDPGLPITQLACADYFLDKGITTIGALSKYPNVGGVSSGEDWDSSLCGETYAIKYGDLSVDILVVDSVQSGIAVSQQAMDELTYGQAANLGQVYVTWSVDIKPGS